MSLFQMSKRLNEKEKQLQDLECQVENKIKMAEEKQDEIRM